MKNFLKRMPKKVFAVVATLAIVAGISSQALAGFGPNRTTKAWTPTVKGFDYVTFNSFTGVPGVGDERDFLRGVQVGRDSAWSDPVKGVENNAEVEMKIYIHNNADDSLNTATGTPGIARNVQVRADLPTGSAQAQQVKAQISANNAKPQQIFDTMDMTGANSGFFEIAYVPGSAKMFDHSTKKTTAISDTLVTSGVNLPDQKGCFQYVREITFRVKVKMPSYATQKVARIHGESADKYRKAVNAKVGDKIDYRIWFKNAGTTQLNNVALVDNLPTHTTIVPGTVKLFNNNNPAPTGYTYPAGAVQKNGRQINVDIGSYAAGTDAYVTFTVTIDNAEVLRCGVHQLINVESVTPKGYGAASDKAYVNIINDKCETPTKPSYICESLKVEQLGGRKVRATVKAPASGGAKLKTVTFNYGDGSDAKVTTNLVDEHQYTADGTYKVTATSTFTVDGKDKAVTSDACTAMVTISTTKETPEELPKTGSAGLIGLFSLVTVAGGVAHNVFTRRSVR